MNWKIPTCLVLAGAVVTSAHLKGGSLVPKGGDVLTLGEKVSITWSEAEVHGVGIDVAISRDGGTTWTNIATGLNDNAKDATFRWTVAGQATTTGKLRICQSGPCTDQNVSKPDGDSPWYLVSGMVTLKAATAIAAPADAAHPISMDFDPQTRNVDVSFGLAEARDVSLQAFDTQGRLLATLIEGNYAAGSHNLSVFSNRLTTGAGSLVFKLKVGDQVRTHTWLTIR